MQKNAGGLEVIVELEQYGVPPSVRSAVNHGLDPANSSVAKDASWIRSLQNLLSLYSSYFVLIVPVLF